MQLSSRYESSLIDEVGVPTHVPLQSAKTGEKFALAERALSVRGSGLQGTPGVMLWVFHRSAAS
jgi:hypothetical protein